MIIDLVDLHPIFLNMLGELLRQASIEFDVKTFASLSKLNISSPQKCAGLMILGVTAAPGSNEQFEYDNFRNQCPVTKVIICYENADSAASTSVFILRSIKVDAGAWQNYGGISPELPHIVRS